MARVYFSAYHDYLEEMALLTMEERGRIFTAMLLYSRGEAVPEGLLEGSVCFLFPRYRLQIDRDCARYARRVQANRENGRKGGRPRSTTRRAGKSARTGDTPPASAEVIQKHDGPP